MSYAKQAVTRLTLDMGLPDVQKSISVTRGDTNRRLEVTLIDRGNPFALPPDWTAVLAGVLPGGDELYGSCIVDDGRIIFDFVAANAVSSEEGVFAVAFDVFDEGGEVVASPKLWVHVTPGVRRLSDPDTVDRLTALQEFVGQINRVDRELAAHTEQIGALEGKITTTGRITIPATDWTDVMPHEAFLSVPGDSMNKGGLLLLAPEDDATKEACARARISVNIDRLVDGDPPATDSVFLIRAESGELPDVPLNFAYFAIRTNSEDQKAAAAIIGVDSYGEGGGTGGGVDSAAVEEIVTRLVPGWARQEEPPADAVKSVNGKTGDVTLGASDVGARPDSWMPTAEDVKARPNTWTPSASDVGADTVGTASAFVAVHNTNETAHNDIRLLIEQHEESVNALLNSDDETLNETKEIVAYIKSNKSLIDSITGSKVNVTDIINNLTTNVTSKPLSAAQGVVLKALIDALGVSKLDASKLTESVNTALAQAKASGEFDGEKGDPGASVTVSNVTTSSADGGSNVVTFSDGKTLTVKNGSKGSTGATGATGATGKSAYAYAKDGGYAGTEAEFAEDINPDNIKAELSQIETPKIVSSVAEMIDITKHYVLNGNIYYNKTVVTEGETIRTYPNQFVPSTAQLNKRLSGSSGSASGKNGYFVTDFIAVPNYANVTPYNVRLNWEMPYITPADDVKALFYNSSKTKLGYTPLGNEGHSVPNTVVSDGKTVIDLRTQLGGTAPTISDVAYIKLQLALNSSLASLTSADIANCEITLDAVYTETTTQPTTKNEWVNSGISYAPTFKTELVGVLGEGDVIYISDNLPSGKTYTLKYPDNNYAIIGEITK